MGKDVLVFGGASLDISAGAIGKVLPADSNPSRITISPGGVGRNISENLSRMGVSVSLMTALGSDAFAEKLVISCEDVGIDLSHCFIRSSPSSNFYLSIMDRSGELVMAASDHTLFESISPEEIISKRDYLSAFPVVFLDANCTEDMMNAIASCVRGKLFADGVSVSKVSRLNSILSKTDTLKLNLDELSGLSGCSVSSPNEVRSAAEALIVKGVRRVIVSLGKNGACTVTGDSCCFIPAYYTPVQTVTGAGDAFAAAVVYAFLHEMDEKETLLLGTAASHIALQSKKTCSEMLTEASLLGKYRELLSLGKPIPGNWQE